MELRCVLRGWGFWGGVFVYLGSCLAAHETGEAAGVLRSEPVRYLLPVAAALPCAAAWQEQTVTGFWRPAVSRCGRCSYCFGLLLACWISGAGAVLLALLICSALVPLTAQAASVLRMGLLAGLDALVGLFGGLAFRSRIAAWFTPFLVCFILSMVKERYFPRAEALDLMRWPAPCVLLAALLAAAALLILMQRRLRA